MQMIKFLGTKEVSKKNGNGTRKGSFGLFLCPVCNKEVEKETVNGKKGKSCGKEGCVPSKSLRHGYTGTKIYNCWANMKQRCNDPKVRTYTYYGAKGIILCAKWESFEGFLEDMGSTFKEGLTIDRIDNTKGYYKDNCQWIKRSENISKDKTKEIIKLDLEGNELARYTSAKEAAEKEGIKYPAAITKVARGERKAYKGYVWKYAL